MLTLPWAAAGVNRYLQYETNLELLRHHRQEDLGISPKQGLADRCLVRRVHFIYERATRRFKGDTSLWIAWMQFCRDTQSQKRLSKVPCPSHYVAFAAWT